MLGKNPKEIEISGPSRLGTIIGVLLILITITGYFFYSGPLGDDVSVIESDITSKSDEIQSIQEQIAEFESAQEELGIATEIDRLESLKAIPAQMYQDEVIRDLITITQTYDIDLNSLSFGKGASDYQDVNSLRINASFEGNYADLVSFLEGLEQNSRIFRVDSISVQITELDIFDLKRVSFSLSMDAYYQGN
jgi:Tfp pilus assembly protein PilO